MMNNKALALQIISPSEQHATIGRVLNLLEIDAFYQSNFLLSKPEDLIADESFFLLDLSVIQEEQDKDDQALAALCENTGVLAISDKSFSHQEKIWLLELGLVDCVSFNKEHTVVAEALLEALCRCEIKRKSNQKCHENDKYQQLQSAYALLEEDQYLALQVQQKIQPPMLSIIDKYCISYRICPSQWLSGDFVHYGQVNDDEILVVLGDVSGHGASSAMVVTAVRYLIYRWSNALSENKKAFSLTALLKAVNAELFVMDTDKHVTLLSAIINIKTGVITVASAGHLPLPVHKKPDSTEWIRVKGQPLGLFPHVNLNEVQLALDQEESLIFCSDGALELQGERSIRKQEQSLLNELGSMPADISTIFTSFNLPVEGDLVDDVAVLVVQRISL